MSPDPLELDETEYAASVRQIYESLQRWDDDVLGEPPHPFLRDPVVADVVRQVEAFDMKLRQRREMTPLSADDGYYIFSEDMVLRLPVVVKVVLEYVRRHPAALTQKEVRLS